MRRFARDMVRDNFARAFWIEFYSNLRRAARRYGVAVDLQQVGKQIQRYLNA